MGWMDVDQRSTDWLKMRTGCTTASRMFDICDRLTRKSTNGEKGSYKQSRHNYLWELIGERLTGRASDHFVTQWMARGQDDEMLARAAYENQSDDFVEDGGFYLHDSIEYFGASPDGLVGDKGLLELKNLKVEKHLQILKGADIPEEYIWQMNAQLACAPEREWVDYGSYCKEMLNPAWRLFVRRHYRDRERVAEIEREVLKFNGEIAFELMELTKVQPIRKTSAFEAVASQQDHYLQSEIG